MAPPLKLARPNILYVSDRFTAALGFTPGMYILGPGETPDPSWVQPLASIIGGRADGRKVRVDGVLTPTQITALTNIWATISLADRAQRLIVDIFNDLGALTASQKANIGTWLFGTGARPHRWETDTGPNGPLIAVMVLMRGGEGGLSVLDKIGIAALWALDFPDAWVNPSFDPTISVAGDAPTA